MIIKKLTLRQVKQVEFLSKFNFVISYQIGKKNNKANALIRKPNKQLINDEDKRCKHSLRILLPLSHIKSAKLQLIEKNKEDHTDWINSDTNFDASDKTSFLSKQVIESNQINELYNKICLYLANPKGLDKLDIYLRDLRVENGLLMKRK